MATVDLLNGKFSLTALFPTSTLLCIVNTRWLEKKIVRNEGQFVLLKVLLVNCSPLHLFSHFSGHKGRDQCNLIGKDIVIMSKIQSGSTRREQRTIFFFSGNYAFVTIHEFWVVLCNIVLSFPQYRLTFLKKD